MCRTGTATVAARRCPSHSNPVKVAERNARRREAYRAEHSTSSVSVAVKTAEEYGFQPLDAERVNTEPLKESVLQSKEEVSHLTEEHIYGIQVFSSRHFTLVNGSLFGRPLLMTQEEIEDPDLMEPEMMTPSGLQETVSQLDSAFLSSPLKERITYRGKAIWDHHLDGLDVQEYVDKNYALNSEVIFDGYQSTSLRPMIGAGYSSNGGIMFEMKSRTGINISSLSHYEYEAEVLLPRSTRWKVVGVTPKRVHYKISDTNEWGVTTQKYVTVVQLVEVDESGEEITERVAPPKLTSRQMQLRKESQTENS